MGSTLVAHSRSGTRTAGRAGRSVRLSSAGPVRRLPIGWKRVRWAGSNTLIVDTRCPTRPGGVMYDQLYRDSQARLQQLLVRLTPDELALPVPACPLWTVQDVLAHLAGVSESIADGSGANPASTEWTRGHIEARKGRTVWQLFEEWHSNTGAVTQLPVTSMSWLPILHDTLSHEADIRGAIGAPQLPGDVLAIAYPLLLASLQRRLSKFGTVRLDLD